MVDSFGFLSLLSSSESRFSFINELDIKGKVVLIRADLNVPLDEDLNITDDTRIRSILPTVNYALDEGARIILASHMDRPKGKVVPELSLAPVVKRLKRILSNDDIRLAPDCIGPEVEKMVSELNSGDILVLENLRFHPGEEANDDEFSKSLAALAEVYINDAFAVSHREHASIVGIAKYAPLSGAGFLMKQELTYFYRAMEDPARPFVAILGGAKVASKFSAIANLMDRVDKLIIGGAMANTFLKAIYPRIGKNTLVEDDLVDKARDLMRKARMRGIKFYIPVDCVVADRYHAKAETKITTVQEVPENWMIVDIGPATSFLFAEAIQGAKTIMWNGPMGAFEIDAFSTGTSQMVNTVANSYALTIVGGGDTDVAINKLGESSRISYISTGGGAFLQLLEGVALPGITALETNAHEEGASGND